MGTVRRGGPAHRLLADLFAVNVPIAGLLIRGSAIFRFVMRRHLGLVGLVDILLLVIVADAPTSRATVK